MRTHAYITKDTKPEFHIPLMIIDLPITITSAVPIYLAHFDCEASFRMQFDINQCEALKKQAKI